MQREIKDFRKRESPVIHRGERRGAKYEIQRDIIIRSFNDFWLCFH